MGNIKYMSTDAGDGVSKKNPAKDPYKTPAIEPPKAHSESKAKLSAMKRRMAK